MARASGIDHYIDGFIVCACGATSPRTADPLAPLRWLMAHHCGEGRR